MTKRILTILVLVLSLSLFASAAEISSANDMLTLMNTPSMWADSYTLTTDINLADATNGLSQTPIGTATTPFAGNFDGAGYTVSGIDISGVGDVGLFGHIGGGGTVSIKNLTVSGNVSATGECIGGIIGRVQATNVTVENCTNLCTVNGGTDFVGGIIGRLALSAETALISGCKNEGAITAGNTYPGGIVGLSTNTSGSTTIEKCLNTASITAKGGAAGIVGYWRVFAGAASKCFVQDCMNTGIITAGASGYAGGIIANSAGKDTAHAVTRCFNTGSVTASAASYVRPIIGRPAAKAVITNCYYTSTDTYVADTMGGAEIFVADATASANVSGLGENFVLVDGYTPELKIFHTHTYKYASIGAEQHNYACYCGDVALTEAHNFVDGVCDKCGALAFCEHENGEWREISVASCVDLAKYVWYCADCVAVIEDITKDGEGLDSDNHVTENYIWNFDGEKYYFTCTACAARVEQADTPTVYLSAKGNDKNDGRTAEEAVATLTEAVSRIANVGGTVMICGSFPLSDTELPAYTKPITFKGDNGYFCGGFKLSKTAVLSLGGKTVFDNILFDGNAAYVIECNWNDVTFGKVEVINNAYTYIVLGAYNITENDDAEKEATVTITEGATLSYNVAGKVSSTCFYNRIYLGDLFGADGISVANKTATLNATNADIDVLYTMSTSGSYKNNPVLNSETTVNLYGKTTVDKGRTGDFNVNYADSTASISKQTINFFDNSSVGSNYYIRNAENTVLHVSDGEEGRTQPMNIGFKFYSYGTFAASSTPMNVNFSYGTHSFAPALINPISFSAVADAQKVVTEQKNDECVYTSKVTVAAAPDANGTKLYSCTCGRTYTEEYVYSCEDAAHLYIANADGAFTCKVCDETFATVSGENVFAVSSATVENGILIVTATVSGNFAAAQFNVAVPAGFAFAKANLPTVDGFVFASGETDGAYAVTILSESAKAKTVDTEIVLEYTLSEGATNDDAFIEVTVPELYTDDGEKAVATTVCAVLAKSECLHEITKEIITLAPTCTNTGSKNIVCAECGAVVEANAVVEKDLSNHGDYDYVCSDGKVVCCGCKTKVDSIDSPVVLIAACEPSESREVSVTVSIKAVAPILASRFVIDAPDGFTLVSAESLIGTADENATGFTLILPDSTSLLYEAIVMNLSLEDATVDAAVLKLTFAVADNVSEGNYIISVNALETYDISGTAIDTTSVPCEVSVSARKAGDIDGNGVVTVLDALKLIRAIVNDETIENGDINGDGKVGLADVIRIMKLIAK